MSAKRFFYVCAGLFLLAAAYTIGARNAEAGFVATGIGPVISVAVDGSYSVKMLRSDGTEWERSGYLGAGWHQLPMPSLPVPVADVAFWWDGGGLVSSAVLMTKDGTHWHVDEMDPDVVDDGRWVNDGQIPLPQGTIAAQGKSWSSVKDQYRK